MNSAAISPKTGPVFFAEEIIISDAHLLNGSSQAEYLLEFLVNSQSNRLILAGDMFDFWEAAKKKTWRPSDTELRIIEAILQKQKEGTDISFIPGNHEKNELRRPSILGRSFYDVSVVPEMRDGKRVITHGDQFDPFVVKWGETVHAAGAHLQIFNPAYHWFNRSYNYIRKAISKNPVLSKLLPYVPSLKKPVSLSRVIAKEAKTGRVEKKQTAALHGVQAKALEWMEQNGVREMVIGHTHVPNIIAKKNDKGEVIARLIDTGDWIENMTFAADGDLRDWSEVRKSLSLNGRPSNNNFLHDPECQQKALELVTALYRLCPGSGRAAGLQKIRVHTEKAHEREERSERYRNFANGVENARRMGDDLKEKLQNEFSRMSHKCVELAEQMNHTSGEERTKLKEKLAWHEEVTAAIGTTLSDRMTEKVDKLCRTFRAKADRLEIRASESSASAQKLRDQLAKWRRFRPPKSERAPVPSLANAA